MQLTYAEIVGRGVPLPIGEAVGLVLAAARALRAATAGDTAATLPPLDGISVDRAGRVTLLPLGEEPAEDPVRCLGVMLHVLLAPDGSTHAPVPGPLMLLAARAAGEIDLPRPSLPEFERLLSRFGSPEPAVLASAYRRCKRPSVAEDISRENPAVARPPLSSVVPESRQYTRLRATVVAAAAVAVLTLLVLANQLFVRWEGDRGGTIRSQQIQVPRPGSPPIESKSSRAQAGAPEQTIAAEPGRPRELRSSTTRALKAAPGRRSAPAPLLTPAVVGADVFSPSFSRAGNDVVFHVGHSSSSLMRASFSANGKPSVETLVRRGSRACGTYGSSTSARGR